MKKGGNNSHKKEDGKMVSKELLRLIEWLEFYGFSSKKIISLIKYISTGDKKYLP